MDQTLALLDDLIKNNPHGSAKHELRAEASYSHDIFSSIENIFREVAEELNSGIPRGEMWHKKLLLEMKNSFPGERDAVISEELFDRLEKCLKFRHLVRNSYGVMLDSSKTREISFLTLESAGLFKQQFNDFLDKLEKDK